MAIRLLASLLVVASVGCSTTGSGGIILFPAPYKTLPETKGLKSSYSSPIAWPRELAKQTTAPATAEPGDLITLAPKEPDSRVLLPAEQPVLLDGSIDLGAYGRAHVAYKTCEEIEAIVEAAVKAKAEPMAEGGVNRNFKVTARFSRAPMSKVVYVLGDVVTPGSYSLEGRETVLDAILLAGGLTRKADEFGIIMVRPTGPCDCRIVLPICYNEIVQWGDTRTNYQVMPGDRIYVPTRSLWSRLFGRPEKKRCPPCNGCPQACPLPPELCCGPNGEVTMPMGSEFDPLAVPAAPNMEVQPPPMAPKTTEPPKSSKTTDNRSIRGLQPLPFPEDVTANPVPWRPIRNGNSAAGPANYPIR